jgi:hypothetical protein
MLPKNLVVLPMLVLGGCRLYHFPGVAVMGTTGP